jgi:aryl-phospho-beta-D-glucosidase BglC (GH1 family)
MFLGAGISAKAQTPLTPQQAVKGMARGINVGNSLDAYPGGETSWGNPALQASFFADLKKAGFDAVRIPITWGYNGRTSTAPPYTITGTFMDRVDSVVTWGLENGLFVIINAHHEAWLKDTLADTKPTDSAGVQSCIARFDSIWSQIATHFQNRSDSLIFEILNEPNPAPQAAVNALNVQVLKIIRRTNPTRIVSYSGYMWSNYQQLLSAEIPDSSDKYLIGYYHSYDPWPFGLNGGTTSTANISSTIGSELAQAASWSQKTGIPVVLGEYGYINTCAYNPRMFAYATVVDQALQQGIAPFAWDDGGNFTISNRNNGTFNEIKDILVHTYPQSPTGLQIDQIGKAIELQWVNRDTAQDRIIIQRRVNSGSFLDLSKVGPAVSQFTDSTASAGTSCYYRLRIITTDSVEMQSYPITINVTATQVVERQDGAVRFQLFDSYPNPFNPSTTIRYNLPGNGFVSLKVYDVLGREVTTLVGRREIAGSHSVIFHAAELPSGVYYYRLRAGSYTATKKLLLLR